MNLDEMHDAPSPGYYGVERRHFDSTRIEGWLRGDGGDGLSGARVEFLRTATTQWQNYDWGSASDDQLRLNQRLVEENSPGPVTGVYPVPPELDPDLPLMIIATEFKGHGEHRHLEACVSWGEPAPNDPFAP